MSINQSLGMLGIPTVKLRLQVCDSRKLLYKIFQSISIVYPYVMQYEKISISILKTTFYKYIWYQKFRE